MATQPVIGVKVVSTYIYASFLDTDMLPTKSTNILEITFILQAIIKHVDSSSCACLTEPHDKYVMIGQNKYSIIS